MAALEMDDEGLKALVDAFYARVRADAALGPIFNNAIADWPEHLDKLAAFWSSVILTSGRYKGQPVPAHMKHKDRITPALFDRWLALWAQTTDELMTPPAAAALQDRAARIAQSLQLAMFFRLDRQPIPGPARRTADATDLPQRSVLP
ncbi:MAG: group III truncated hemoglobin [Sphingobium sp.]|uniref:group III truncated hemoglobin n=1 Tax=unclassified Sphingobium TaxID=2611147 RepID=UPI0003D59392|nr:group III truncated hemoglobin [Sphingobium sp. C100]ETI64566.1 SEC-independent protein translocase TatC [Sphingobium sp. C100]